MNSETRLNDVLWGIRRSIRYHTRRRAFFDRLSMWGSALALLMGSVAITTSLRGIGEGVGEGVILVLGVVTTLVSVINLVVGSTGKARTHHDLVRKFSKLETDMVCKLTPTDDDVAKLECGRLEIEAEEPPKLYVLDAVCHNELVIAEKRSLDQLSDIGPLQWLFKDVGDWRPGALRTREQAAEDRALKLAAKGGGIAQA